MPGSSGTAAMSATPAEARAPGGGQNPADRSLPPPGIQLDSMRDDRLPRLSAGQAPETCHSLRGYWRVPGGLRACRLAGRRG
jgi:hypothetical protein